MWEIRHVEIGLKESIIKDKKVYFGPYKKFILSLVLIMQRKNLKRDLSTLEHTAAKVYDMVVAKKLHTMPDLDNMLYEHVNLLKHVKSTYTVQKKQKNPSGKFHHFAFRMQKPLIDFVQQMLPSENFVGEELTYFNEGMISSRAISPILTMIGCSNCTRQAIERMLPAMYDEFSLSSKRVTIPIMTAMFHRLRATETDTEKKDRDLLLGEYHKIMKVRHSKAAAAES
jgi:hypothetical protein